MTNTTTEATMKDLAHMTIPAMMTELQAIYLPWVATAKAEDMAYWYIRVDATNDDYFTLAAPVGAAVEIEEAGYMIRSNTDFS